MNSKKTVIRFFTIADYEEEEVWLHNQHKNGWKLLRMIPPCFYIFEKCAPEDVAYRLDYKNSTETGDYFQAFRIMVGNISVGALDGCIFAKQCIRNEIRARRRNFL